jgi:amidase
MRLSLTLGRHLTEEYRGRYHRYGQSLRSDLRDAYDEALAEVDVLAMPTTPQSAHERVADLSLNR